MAVTAAELTVQSVVFAVGVLGTVWLRFPTPRLLNALAWVGFTFEIFYMSYFSGMDNIAVEQWSAFPVALALVVSMIVGYIIHRFVDGFFLRDDNEVSFLSAHTGIYALVFGWDVAWTAFWLNGDSQDWTLIKFYGFWLTWIGAVMIHIGLFVWAALKHKDTHVYQLI